MNDAKLALRKEIGLAYLRMLRCGAVQNELIEAQHIIIGSELWETLKGLGLTTPEILKSLDLTISDSKSLYEPQEGGR